MAAKLITDDVWNRIKAFLPERAGRATGGRPPLGDREVLTGVVFVLKTDIAWEDLPEEMGCGCGMTCLRRLKQWHQMGVWPRMQEILRFHLRNSDRYNWERAGDSVTHNLPDNERGSASEFELSAENRRVEQE